MGSSSAPSAGQTQAPADANVGWESLKSSSGNEYRVKALDYNIAEKPTGEELDAADASGPSFKDVKVNWTFGSEGAPSPDVQNKTAITYYKLGAAEWYSPYKYKLTISCKDTYNYEFTDESGDTYTINVWQTSGTHTVEYRSDNPTIVSVSGS